MEGTVFHRDMRSQYERVCENVVAEQVRGPGQWEEWRLRLHRAEQDREDARRAVDS